MSTLSVELYRSVTRYLAQRAIGRRLPGLVSGPIASLRLVHREDPEPPAPGWARVRPRLSGICGSDLATIAGEASMYLSALVSMPFVPGHEVVGELAEDVDGLAAGQRVVLDPILACVARGIDPPCGPCATGRHGLCERVTGGHVATGLQTGYCAGTGGGWSEMFVAHRAQMHPVPDAVDDRTALLTEPLACAIHAVRRAAVPRDARVLVSGSGTVGLLTIAALRETTEAGPIVAVAKHAHQAALARRYGATEVVGPGEALGAIRRATRAFRLHPERSASFLLGGAEVSFECAGSRSSLDLALRATRARGRVVLAGMPPRADLTPAWYRELEVVGAYSGAGAFVDALAMLEGSEMGGLVSAAYPLSRWREAVDHALSAGRLGSIKIAFDPTMDGADSPTRLAKE